MDPPSPDPSPASSSPTAGPTTTQSPATDVGPTSSADVDPIMIATRPLDVGPTPDPVNDLPPSSPSPSASPSSPHSGPTSPVKIPPPPSPTSKVPLPDAGPTSVMSHTTDVGPTPVKTKSIQATEKGFSLEKAPPPASPMTDLPLSDPPPSAAAADPTAVVSTGVILCPHTDLELVRKLAHLLNPGLATAAVDSTTGDPFRSPATVAVDLRRDLTDYVTLRSDSLVPQSLALLAADPALDGLPDLDDPLDLLSHLIEEFTASKRNLLGRVSGWVLSDLREDKIDDFVQEMELNNFWKLELREALAGSLLKNLDYKNKFHCSMRFNSDEELEMHKKDCSFRPVSCKNEGCKVKYCIKHEEQHDKACPYKVLECDQRCGERIMRREMDRHCITVCKMKAMNCPFYHLGCQTSFPQCELRDHCGECMATHLVCVMGVKNEEGLGEEELKARAKNMEKV